MNGPLLQLRYTKTRLAIASPAIKGEPARGSEIKEQTIRLRSGYLKTNRITQRTDNTHQTSKRNERHQKLHQWRMGRVGIWS